MMLDDLWSVRWTKDLKKGLFVLDVRENRVVDKSWTSESKKHGFGSRILGGTRFLARLGLG